MNVMFFLLMVMVAGYSLAEELHIDKDGNFYIEYAPVASANNNFVVITVWGTRWTVFMDVGTKVLGADEMDLKFTNIQAGHLLTVEGKYSQEFKYIDAKKVIDESIGVPKPKAVSSAASAVVATPDVTYAAAGGSSGVEVFKILSYLRPGSRGPEVTFLQKFLLNNGFITADNVTGYFGQVTRNALKSFQESYGLDSVGMTGPKTRNFINSFDPLLAKKIISTPGATILGVRETFGVAGVSSTPDVTPAAAGGSSGVASVASMQKYLVWGMEGDDVRMLQKFLSVQGFLAVDNITGYFGWATHTALTKFQKANGLEQSGTLGPKTREIINSIFNKR